ncbi:MAG: OsmC family protein, partial [Verrucomicrobiota bacterium]
GEAFSPTDLVATALASCMLTTMGIVAQRHDIDLYGATSTVRKGMTAEGPRRIAVLEVEITLPYSADHPKRVLLEKAAGGCPVHRSLDDSVEVRLGFRYQQ